jgi:hypothetical protein
MIQFLNSVTEWGVRLSQVQFRRVVSGGFVRYVVVAAHHCFVYVLGHWIDVSGTCEDVADFYVGPPVPAGSTGAEGAVLGSPGGPIP